MPDMACVEQLVDDLNLEAAVKLIGMFRDETATRVKFIEDYVDEGVGDIVDLHRHAHTLKGMCLTYGALKAADAAKDLQSACDEKNLELIQEKALVALNVIPFDVKAVVNFMATYAANHE